MLAVPGEIGHNRCHILLLPGVIMKIAPRQVLYGLAIIGLLVVVLWIPEVGDSLFRFAFQLFRALGGSVQDFVAGYDSFRFWTAPGR